MSTITKERAQQIFLGNGPEPTASEERELARIALASLEAEAVAEVCEGFALRYIGYGPAPKSVVHIGDRLYTAPPAPVSVPEPIKRNDADGWWMYKGRRVGGGCAEWYNLALDDCRAAMLQGADGTLTNEGTIPGGNSPVIADGLCPCCGRKPLKNKTCSVAGCDGKHVARGFCVKHYALERKKDPSRRESIRAADKRYRARKAAAPQQEVKS